MQQNSGFGPPRTAFVHAVHRVSVRGGSSWVVIFVSAVLGVEKIVLLCEELFTLLQVTFYK